jgi:hypothetical protein
LEANYLILPLIVISLLLLISRPARTLRRIRLWFYNRHVIVIGLSRAGKQVALNLAKEGRKVVVISEEAMGPDADAVRSHGGIVFHDAELDEAQLKRAGLRGASTIFIATDDDDTNIRLAQFISGLKKRKFAKDRVRLMVQVKDHDLKNLISDYLDISSQGAVDIQPFNIGDVCARLVYDTYPPHVYLADETARDTEKIICIVGNNDIARSFLVENSILSHYGDQKKLKVLVVCERAEEYLATITKEFPGIADFLDILAVELKNDNFSSRHAWDERFLKAIDSLDAAYFFGDHDARLINSALHFRQFIYEKTRQVRRVPVIVCLPEETRVVSLLEAEEETSGKPSLSERLKQEVVVHMVRKYSDTCSVKQMIDVSGGTEMLAKAINFYYAIKYEFDGILQAQFKKSGNSEFIKRLERELLEFKVKKGEPLAQIEQLVVDFIKDYTKNSAERIRSVLGINALWRNLTDRKKESNRYVARHLEVKFHVLKKLGLKNLTRDDIKPYVKQLAPIEHNRWMAEKLSFDFTFGDLPSGDKNLRKILKDTLKVHDQLVPFNRLDDTNREKDLDMFYLLPLLQKIKEST